jgi:hypothetical protein
MKSLLALLACVLLLTGCGSTLLKPSGRILKDGKPLRESLPKSAVVFFSLYHENDTAGSDPLASSVLDDGTFQIVGRTGSGVPPGRYRFVLTAPDPYPQGKDAFAGRFATPRTTKITRDIVDASEIVIDVATEK